MELKMVISVTSRVLIRHEIGVDISDQDSTSENEGESD